MHDFNSGRCIRPFVAHYKPTLAEERAQWTGEEAPSRHMARLAQRAASDGTLDAYAFMQQCERRTFGRRSYDGNK